MRESFPWMRKWVDNWQTVGASAAPPGGARIAWAPGLLCGYQTSITVAFATIIMIEYVGRGGAIMIKRHLIWLVALGARGLLVLVFIFAARLPRLPFIFK